MSVRTFTRRNCSLLLRKNFALLGPLAIPCLARSSPAPFYPIAAQRFSGTGKSSLEGLDGILSDIRNIAENNPSTKGESKIPRLDPEVTLTEITPDAAPRARSTSVTREEGEIDDETSKIAILEQEIAKKKSELNQLEEKERRKMETIEKRDVSPAPQAVVSLSGTEDPNGAQLFAPLERPAKPQSRPQIVTSIGHVSMATIVGEVCGVELMRDERLEKDYAQVMLEVRFPSFTPTPLPTTTTADGSSGASSNTKNGKEGEVFVQKIEVRCYGEILTAYCGTSIQKGALVHVVGNLFANLREGCVVITVAKGGSISIIHSAPSGGSSR